MDRTSSKLEKLGWAIAAVLFLGGFPHPTLLAVGFRPVEEQTPKPTTDTLLNSL
jgi:hypothetical protein